MGHVQEDVRGAVELGEAAVDRDVAEQRGVPGEPELVQARLQLAGHGAVADDDEPAVDALGPEAGERVGEQQRVLLAVQPPHAEDRRRPARGPGQRVLDGDDVRLLHERDGELEHGARAGVVAGQVGPDDRDGEAPGHPPEGPLEDVGGDVGPATARVAAADVHRQVLAHAEHDAAAAQPREPGEDDRLGERAEQPHDIHVVQRPPEAPRAGERRADGPRRTGQALVVGQADELDVAGDGVVRAAGFGMLAAEQHEPVDVRAQGAHEAHEGALGGDAGRVAAVDVVGVDREAHQEGRSEGASTRPA